MNRRAMLSLTAATTATVSILSVVLVSSLPEIAPGIALAGILGGGALLAGVLAYGKNATPALITFAMFLSLLPLLAIAGGNAFLLWTAGWVLIGVASKRLSMQTVHEAVERVTRTLA